jgi:hypothetical protein
MQVVDASVLGDPGGERDPVTSNRDGGGQHPDAVAVALMDELRAGSQHELGSRNVRDARRGEQQKGQEARQV